jgi:hypothetical protein
MKDLGAAKQILGVHIQRSRKDKKLFISQEQYIEKVLERFNMNNAKVVSSPLATHFKLSTNQSPSTDEEKEDMERIPYASAVGSLMYAMVCTRPDIAHAVGVVSWCNTPSPLRLGLSPFFFSNKIFAKIHKVYQSTLFFKEYDKCIKHLSRAFITSETRKHKLYLRNIMNFIITKLKRTMKILIIIPAPIPASYSSMLST